MKDVYIAAAAQIVSETQRPLVKDTAEIDMNVMANHVVTFARLLEQKFNQLSELDAQGEKVKAHELWKKLGS